MDPLSIRKPAVAGRFYPAESKALSSMIKEIIHHEKHKLI